MLRNYTPILSARIAKHQTTLSAVVFERLEVKFGQALSALRDWFGVPCCCRRTSSKHRSGTTAVPKSTWIRKIHDQMWWKMYCWANLLLDVLKVEGMWEVEAIKSFKTMWMK